MTSLIDRPPRIPPRTIVSLVMPIAGLAYEGGVNEPTSTTQVEKTVLSAATNLNSIFDLPSQNPILQSVWLATRLELRKTVPGPRDHRHAESTTDLTKRFLSDTKAKPSKAIRLIKAQVE